MQVIFVSKEVRIKEKIQEIGCSDRSNMNFILCYSRNFEWFFSFLFLTLQKTEKYGYFLHCPIFFTWVKLVFRCKCYSNIFTTEIQKKYAKSNSMIP